MGIERGPRIHQAQESEPDNQSCHRRDPRGQQEFLEQHAHCPAVSGKREGPHDHRAPFHGHERSALLRQGDKEGREGDRGSSAEQAREAFRAQTVAKRREGRDRDPAGKEPQAVFKHRCPLGNHPTANGFILWRQFGAFCAAPQTTSRIFAMPNFINLPPFTEDGDVHVVVETPRGSRAKFEYDPKLETFILSKSLLTGLTYPHDWGFVPSTRADDGDPLDIMVIHDAATFPGVVLACRIIGILQIEQKSKGKAQRNDRLFAVPRRSHSEQGLRVVLDLSKPI